MPHSKPSPVATTESVSTGPHPKRKNKIFWLILLPAAIGFVALMAILACVDDFLPSEQNASPFTRETWDLLSIAGQRVGASNVCQWQTNRNGQPIVVTEATDRLQFSRQGQTASMKMIYRTEETPRGDLLAIRCQQQAGNEPAIVQTGILENGQLVLHQQTGATQSTRTIDWPADALGYFGMEHSLREKMLVPGERRSLRCLMPLVNQLACIELTAGQFESVEMASGTTVLLRVEVAARLDQSPLPSSTIWCDGAGEVIKSVESSMQLASERSTRQLAQWRESSPTYDILAGSLVPVASPLSALLDEKQIVYEVKLANSSPVEAFAQDDRQQVSPLDDRRARITARATWLAEQEPTENSTATQPPGPDALAATGLIQADDPKIVALANRVAAEQSDPRHIALELEKLVHRWIETKGYAQVFASAREVAASRSGDCTEHAMLLAAVCRARQIPARLAVGLVYVPEMQGFLFHMWTEVWWGQQWHPLDATLGRGGIGPTHLKLRTFTLADDNMLAEAMVVAQVIGQLEIRAVE